MMFYRRCVGRRENPKNLIKLYLRKWLLMHLKSHLIRNIEDYEFMKINYICYMRTKPKIYNIIPKNDYFISIS